jgi:hypothetical protein
MVLPVFFLNNTEFNPYPFFDDLNGLKFKVIVAEGFRNLQQKITESAAQAENGVIPLNLRLLIKVINRTARELKSQREIENSGITSGNVIFS